MTYWATLWYAGTVVFSLGYEGQTFKECLDLTQFLMRDINFAYQSKGKLIDTRKPIFPVNKFTTTCQTDFLEPGELYLK